MMQMLDRWQVFSRNISGILLAVSDSKVLTLHMCIVLANWKENVTVWKVVDKRKSALHIFNSLMQCTAELSSNLLRQTLQNLRLTCVGSDQQWATGFLMRHGAMPEHGVTTLVTHFSCTMKLHAGKRVNLHFHYACCMFSFSFDEWTESLRFFLKTSNQLSTLCVKSCWCFPQRKTFSSEVLNVWRQKACIFRKNKNVMRIPYRIQCYDVGSRIICKQWGFSFLVCIEMCCVWVSMSLLFNFCVI